MHRPKPVPALRKLLAALLAAGALGAAPRGNAGLHGSYRVEGTALVRASPLVDERVSVELAVLVGAAAREDQLALHLSAKGYACSLVATVARAPAGALELAPGQACAVELREPEARGPVKATLREGRGRLAGGTLALELAFDVAGDVSMQMGGRRVEVLGRVVEVPEAWAPRMPVSGTMDARCEGPREASSGPGKPPAPKRHAR